LKLENSINNPLKMLTPFLFHVNKNTFMIANGNIPLTTLNKRNGSNDLE